ncbi:MAG TPA: methanogenesis marker 8 protein [Methanoregulaceae archaeon]|nr:methanogenesis marker 8 protein [Methanoregulaceae archaeon]
MDCPEDEHIIEAIGKSRIVVRNGKVVEVGPSLIMKCPLAERFAKPVHEITPGAVKENWENRIREIGMCTDQRRVSEKGEFVGFGASELISAGLRFGLIDSAVIASDGAGTVIVTSPELVQGIGGRMSGLVKTSPLPGVIAKIEEHDGIVLDPVTARIDMVAGTVLAYAEGFRNVAVTIAIPSDATQIRALCPGALIIAVHTTGLTRKEVEELSASADLITACASLWVREVAGRKALLQAGTAIPVFAMTKRGKALILDKLKETEEPVFIKGSKLPFAGDSQPTPLV